MARELMDREAPVVTALEKRGGLAAPVLARVVVELSPGFLALPRPDQRAELERGMSAALDRLNDQLDAA